MVAAQHRFAHAALLSWLDALHFALPDTHSGFDHVDYIVAELLALLDDIHIHGATGVRIGVAVDIVDVFVLQLVAVVVDFVLDVKGAVGVKIVLVALEHHVHLRQGIVGQLKHLVQMLILWLGEVFLALHLTIDGAGNVVARVADALKLRNLA